MAKEKYGVERARVVFGLSAKAIRELGEHPCASRAWLVGVEDVRPGMPKQLVFVRMLLSERKIATADLFESFGGKEMLIQLSPEAYGHGIEERLFVAEALINCWRGAAGFACYGTQRQAMFATGAP